MDKIGYFLKNPNNLNCHLCNHSFKIKNVSFIINWVFRSKNYLFSNANFIETFPVSAKVFLANAGTSIL